MFFTAPVNAIIFLAFLQATFSEEANDYWFTCSSGWELQLKSCYRVVTTPVDYSTAQQQCSQWEGDIRLITNDEENELFSVAANGVHYWLAAWSRSTDVYAYKNGLKTFNKLEYGTIDGRTPAFSSPCVKWHSLDKSWTRQDCSLPLPYICQRSPDVCVPGRYGQNCSERCHCQNKPCSDKSGICEYGCKPGWIGLSCNIQRQKAEAKFYCFKLLDVNTMILRLNQRGTRYRYVISVDKEGEAFSACNETVFERFEVGGLATLKIQEKEPGIFHPSCTPNKVEEEVYSWRIKLQEFPFTSSAYDIIFGVRCDFSNAETLTPTVTSNTDKSSSKSTVLTESKVSITFNILDPFQGQQVTSARLGQEILLQLVLDNADDVGVNGIAPYNCSASTFDGVHSVTFVDEHGCSVYDAQVLFHIPKDVTRWRTRAFEAFTFAGYDSVNFECHVQICFSDSLQDCQNMCAQTKKYQTTRRNRRHSRHNRKTATIGVKEN